MALVWFAATDFLEEKRPLTKHLEKRETGMITRKSALR
jgi:hypothetical protein